jgi:hypothetical protein
MQNTQSLPANLTNVRARRTDARPAVRSNLLVGILLVGVMLIGAYFRYTGLNWDDFTHLHPDERFQTDVAQGIGRNLNPSGDAGFVEAQIAQCLNRYPDTGGKGGYFDALCSPLNPLNANSQHGLYVYGTLPLFMARGGADLYGDFTTWYAGTFQNQPNYDGSLSSACACTTSGSVCWRHFSMPEPSSQYRMLTSARPTLSLTSSQR